MSQDRAPRKRREETSRDPALLGALNEAQREAVTTTAGPLLVLAGAGTGKTRVITYRIAYLLHGGTPPESVLAVTFTNKAAREMRERVADLLGKRPEGLTLSTFHSLGARILRAEARAAGLHRDFNIYDTADQLSLVRTLLREVRGAAPGIQPDSVLWAISRAKNKFHLPEDVSGSAIEDWEVLVAHVYRRYQESLRDVNCVDFDDLILLPALLMKRDPKMAERYRARYRYILVDEYQDTNAAQYRFLRSLVGPHRNLCVVGDDDQSIYAFRGAEMDKILRFERDFPGARVVKLEENYRSTTSILNLANAVIAQSPGRHEKTLRSRLGPGVPARWVTVADEVEEVDCILGEVQGLLLGGENPASVAILLRAASQARPFEEKLRLRRIPYVFAGGPSYFDRKEIRDVMAYWKVAANPKDDFSLLRIVNVPPRGFGGVTIRKLDELARSRKTSILEALGLVCAGEGDFIPSVRSASRHVVDLFSRARERIEEKRFGAMARGLVEDSSYAEVVADLYPDPLTRAARWAAVEELLAFLERWEGETRRGDFLDFLEALTLDREDSRDEEGETRAVRLMTLHSAKGLEFSTVFLAGLEEDMLPHKKAQEEGEAAVQEERRLFYVGITRARKNLVITSARTRTLYGEARPRKPSRFLQEVEETGLLAIEEHDPHQEATEEDVQRLLESYRSSRRKS
jgi:DNA helicase-2/ATP-dependent DNA helicase PcrA